MKYHSARTKTACEIANLDPDRFNEAVASGAFPCAPPTRRGSSRVFDVNDIITLRVYSRLIDEGMIAKKAGPLACGLRDLLKLHPDAERAVHVVVGLGSSTWILRDDFDPDAADFSGSDVVSFREWRLGWSRTRIQRYLEDAAGVVGED